ncbi:MAG: hypothetical protein KKH88_03875 [Nanoarchaeota archaeon]|nr:hypothetical protein [Nanoarchaeota archaeon]
MIILITFGGGNPDSRPGHITEGPGYSIAEGIISRELSKLDSNYTSADVRAITGKVETVLKSGGGNANPEDLTTIQGEIERIADEKEMTLLEDGR